LGNLKGKYRLVHLLGVVRSIEMCVIMKRWEGVELDISGCGLSIGERGGCADVNRIIS
jgi:hypothetical protein